MNHPFIVNKISSCKIKIYEIKDFLTELECKKIIECIERENIYRKKNLSDKGQEI